MSLRSTRSVIEDLRANGRLIEVKERVDPHLELPKYIVACIAVAVLRCCLAMFEVASFRLQRICLGHSIERGLSFARPLMCCSSGCPV